MVVGRILLVEDEWLIRSSLGEELREEGYEVLEAGTADEGAQILDGNSVDLLLTDVRMPGKLDGIDLAAYARTGAPGLPLLIVSGFAEHITHRLTLFSEPIVFIAKPFGMDQIVEGLRRLLPGSGG